MIKKFLGFVFMTRVYNSALMRVELFPGHDFLLGFNGMLIYKNKIADLELGGWYNLDVGLGFVLFTFRLPISVDNPYKD